MWPHRRRLPRQHRRPRLPTRVTPRRPAALVVAAILAAALAGCTPTTAASAPAAPAAGPGTGGLVAEDPDHNTVQPFPARGTCHARPVAGGVLPDPACTPGAIDRCG